MKRTNLCLCLALSLLVVASAAWASGAGTTISADEALKLLKEGNARFAECSLQNPNTDQTCRLRNAKEGQMPFVTVLSCSDSRVPVELLFDRGIGDIFVIRVAGNVSDVDESGSIEYGVEHLGTPLLIVLGHTRCGAVTAVAKNAEVHGNIPALVENIKPAVVAAKKKVPDTQEAAFVEEAIRMNVWQSIEDLFKSSEAMRSRARGGKVKVVGALYDIENGRVEWMGSHPDEAKLIQ